jgi:hypothetical protein
MLAPSSSMQAETCTPQVLAETALEKTVAIAYALLAEYPSGDFRFWIAKPFVRMSFVNSSVAFFFQNSISYQLSVFSYK